VLEVLWNGEVIKNDGKLKEIGRELLKEVFEKYKTDRVLSKKTVVQSLTASYSPAKPGNLSGDGQMVQEQVENIQDAKRFVAYVDECLRILPGVYKKIIIEDYIRGKDDKVVYIDLGLPKSTYYYMKSDAIDELVREFIYKSVNV
jgi:ArpU family phage transcriptional regulator